MATDAANDIAGLLHIEKKHADSLQHIRHWSNIKIAADGDTYWLKDVTAVQLDSLLIKSIPFLAIYYVKDGKLFPSKSKLPVRKAPSSLLWTPVEKALPINLPGFNHNYFGIEDKLSVSIVRSEEEQPPIALLTSLVHLQHYMETAPAIRLKSLSWVIINDKALITGTPILPLQGEGFWQSHGMLLPSGYDLSLSLLAPLISKKIDEHNNSIILWNKDSSYIMIPQSALMPLSISSFRNTISSLDNKQSKKERSV